MFRRYDSIDEFLIAAGPTLEAHETTASLMLGICSSLKAGRSYGQGVPLLSGLWKEEAPVVLAVCTPPHNLVLFAEETDAARLDELAQALHAQGHEVPGCHGTLAVAEAFSSAWCRRTGQVAKVSMRQKAFRLDSVVAPRSVAGQIRGATEGDIDWLVRWAEAFQREAIPGGLSRDPRPTVEWMLGQHTLWIWDDGGPVSIAAGMRPTEHGIAVGLVYTPPEHRGRGYASNCVAAVSQKLLDMGYTFCTLFTDLANPTSNKIYQQIGYRPIAEFCQIEFRAPSN